MRKIIAITVLSLFTTATFSQNSNFEFSNLQTNLWGNANDQMTGRAYIKNITSDTLHVKVKRNPVSVVSGSSNSFCWDVCYTSITSESVHSVTMIPDSAYPNFYADFLPNGNVGLSSIKYCFFDEDVATDSICLIAYFNASATGIETTILPEGNYISDAFPNPSNGTAQLIYSVKKDAGSSKLEIHNILGSLVKVVELKEKNGSVKLPLEDVGSGIYFCSLVVDNKTISTKKLVVSK